MITRERETAGRDHKSEQPKHDMITRDSAVAAVAGALLRTAELVDPALPGWGGGGVALQSAHPANLELRDTGAGGDRLPTVW